MSMKSKCSLTYDVIVTLQRSLPEYFQSLRTPFFDVGGGHFPVEPIEGYQALGAYPRPKLVAFATLFVLTDLSVRGPISSLTILAL